MDKQPTFRQQVRQEIYQEIWSAILSLFFGGILLMVFISFLIEFWELVT